MALLVIKMLSYKYNKRKNEYKYITTDTGKAHKYITANK